jgi:hypothetical protein
MTIADSCTDWGSTGIVNAPDGCGWFQASAVACDQSVSKPLSDVTHRMRAGFFPTEMQACPIELSK